MISCCKWHLAAVRTLTAGLEVNWASEFVCSVYTEFQKSSPRGVWKNGDKTPRILSLSYNVRWQQGRAAGSWLRSSNVGRYGMKTWWRASCSVGAVWRKEAGFVGDSLHKWINMNLHWCAVCWHCSQSDTACVSSGHLCWLARRKPHIAGHSSGAEH